MKPFLYIFIISLFFSCSQNKEQVDLLVTNANVYTVNDAFDVVEAFAVKDKQIIAVGTTKDIQQKYTSSTVYNLEGKTVVPGFIDAHAHFYGFGESLQTVDLTGAKSYDEVLQRVVDFQNRKQKDFIKGRGWNQNLWEDKEFPTKDKLDSLFPDTPVVLTRIDGHAFLVNQKVLDLADITAKTKLPGGEVVLKNGQPTGVLIDKPMELVKAIAPKTSVAESVTALKDAQDICFSYGLTTVNDAGLEREIIELIDSLQKANELNIRIYAMVSGNKPATLDYYLKEGIVKTDYLNVRSVKVYGDGALGSRGAALKAPYTDKPDHHGAMVTQPEELQELANRIVKTDYQMNTHAIGDSANAFVLKTYQEVLKNQKDRRWKIEHAQVIAPEDFSFFKNENVIPSVQPTHATSDMYWAEERLGAKRIKGAYAYQDLLNQAGKIALGTDFPIEHVSPFYTFYAAVARKDLEAYPSGGFQTENALSREDALRGMTIWAAYSNFEENEKGSIEVGKWADFIILDTDLMTAPESDLPHSKVEATFVGGEKVFEK